MGDLDRALGAYERALIINSQSWAALTMAAHVCRCKEDYGRVSPVSNSSLSTFPYFLALAFSYPGSCVCATGRPPALTLRSCLGQPWRQTTSETTTPPRIADA